VAPRPEVKGDYAQFYKDTKAMGKSKGWNDDKITAALADRNQTEKQIKNVSSKIFNFLI